MKQKHLLVNKIDNKDIHRLLDKILENCYIDAISGKFRCKRCHNVVHIDWYRNKAFCTTHVISQFGIAYFEKSYEIYL